MTKLSMDLYPPVTMPNPQSVTWADIETLALDYPQVRHAVTLVEMGKWKREQALLMLVHVYVDAWQRSFKQLVDRRNRELPERIVVPARHIDRPIEDVVEELFTNGSGQKADRLVLAVDSTPKRDLGGWCRGAIVDRLHAALVESAVPYRADWQPIDTAPRDGNWFWVKRENIPLDSHIQESVFKWDARYKGWFSGTGWWGNGDLKAMRFTRWRLLHDQPVAASVSVSDPPTKEKK